MAQKVFRADVSADLVPVNYSLFGTNWLIAHDVEVGQATRWTGWFGPRDGQGYDLPELELTICEESDLILQILVEIQKKKIVYKKKFIYFFGVQWPSGNFAHGIYILCPTGGSKHFFL